MEKRIKHIVLLIVLFSLSTSYSWAQRYYKVDPVSGINDRMSDEMAPSFYKGGIIFCSNRKSEILFTNRDQSNAYLYNLYFIESKGNKWSAPQLFAPELNTRYTEAWPFFDPKGNGLYFSRTTEVDDKIGDRVAGDSRLGLFLLDAGRTNWSSPNELPFNSSEYDLISPAIGDGGQTLFFASKAPGGYGGYDIYFSKRQGQRWSEPQNIGPEINTETDDLSPFYHSSERLYFASKGHNSMGGLDIFYSDRINGKWTTPIPLDRPINSRSDDFAYIINEAMDSGYFTSNRNGSDDIFQLISSFPSFPECPDQVKESFCYEFYEQSTLDMDTSAFKFEWHIGEAKIRQIKVVYCFPEPGQYHVELNVIDSLTGDVYFSVASYDLTVEPIEQGFITCPDTAIVDERIDFSALESTISSYEITDYYWDFGDGQMGKGEEENIRYRRPGAYDVKLGIVGKDAQGTEQKSCVRKQIFIRQRP